MKKIFAFTLAEVLITLGIIGIVAALTIPGLITKCKEMQYRTIYKKVYSSLNQAMKYAQEDDGADLSLYPKIGDYGTMEANIGDIFKYISQYYNAPITCFNGDNSACWACEDGEAGSLSGSAPNWLGCRKANYAFVDTNGVAYYLYSSREDPIVIDVNGKRKPNQLGRDRFVMRFGNSLEPNTLYPDTVDAVLFEKDVIKNVVGVHKVIVCIKHGLETENN